MHRRTVAFATGLTLPAVDKVVQQAKDRGPSAAWFDHFRKIRLVPTHVQTESTLAQMTARHWTAVELDALLRLANRMKRSEEHTSELQSLMRISYAVFCLK